MRNRAVAFLPPRLCAKHAFGGMRRGAGVHQPASLGRNTGVDAGENPVIDAGANTGVDTGVLAQHAVGVLAVAALPWTVRVTVHDSTGVCLMVIASETAAIQQAVTADQLFWPTPTLLSSDCAPGVATIRPREYLRIDAPR